MKNIVLEVARSEIERQVADSTAYLGLKSPSSEERGELVERVATIADDVRLVDGFVTDAYALLLERLKEFVAGSEVGEGEIRVILEVSEAYDEAMTPTIKKCFRGYVVSFVMARWLRLVYPDKASEWEAEAALHLSTMERNLYHRTKPKRKPN